MNIIQTEPSIKHETHIPPNINFRKKLQNHNSQIYSINHIPHNSNSRTQHISKPKFKITKNPHANSKNPSTFPYSQPHKYIKNHILTKNPLHKFTENSQVTAQQEYPINHIPHNSNSRTTPHDSKNKNPTNFQTPKFKITKTPHANSKTTSTFLNPNHINITKNQILTQNPHTQIHLKLITHQELPKP